MQIRFRILEHLMRSMLESQAAMMTAMTQMQQAMLSRMMPKPVETGAEARQQAIKPEEAGSKTDQPVTASTEASAAQRRAPAPRRPRAQPTKPRPSWFGGFHLINAGVKLPPLQ